MTHPRHLEPLFQRLLAFLSQVVYALLVYCLFRCSVRLYSRAERRAKIDKQLQNIITSLAKSLDGTRLSRDRIREKF